MRICIATGNFYEPGETQVNHHIKYLFDGNTVVLSRRSNGEDPFGKPVHIWREKQRGLAAVAESTLLGIKMLTWRSTAVATDAEQQRMVNFLATEKVDVLLAEFGHHALPIYGAAVAAGVPFFVYFRGADASKHLRKFGRAASYRHMLKRSAGIFAVSSFLLDELSSRGIRHHFSRVIPSGVDTQLVNPATKVTGRYIFVGRFVEKKRPQLALEAFSNLAMLDPEIRLRMIGSGPLESTCRERALELGLLDRVEFMGQLDHASVLTELSSAQFLIMPSTRAANGDTEGLPMVVQEAMAAGAIVVSTDHAGIPEAVKNGVTGILAPESDPAAFHAALRKSAELNADEVARMSHDARTLAVEYFDKIKLTARLEADIADAITKLSLMPYRTSLSTS